MATIGRGFVKRRKGISSHCNPPEREFAIRLNTFLEAHHISWIQAKLLARKRKITLIKTKGSCFVAIPEGFSLDEK